MRTPFALLFAWRELRAAWRRLGLYMGAIAIGVAALVAINSFRAAVLRSVEGEARTLLGADVRLSSGAPFAEPVVALLDSLEKGGGAVARATQLGSMVLAPASGEVRLLQLRAVEGGFPFYGTVETEPAGLWPLPRAERRALVDPAVLVQLGARVGDTLAIGAARFVIAGTAVDKGGEVGIQSAIGPRVYIPAAFLEETGLIGYGSLVRYQAYLRLDGDGAAERFVKRYRPLLREQQVRAETAEGEVERMGEAMGAMGRYLALVGLMAVLLGGVAVASAVHAFIEERLTVVAVLRCLGAPRRTVFLAYLLQTGILGVGGALVGAAGGVAVQAVLPAVLGDFLPVDVGFRVHWPSVLAGLGVGGGVTLLFALLPLLAVREVPPLAAIRRHVEREGSAGGRWRALAYAGVASCILLLSIAQAPSWRAGLVFAVGIGVILAALRGAAGALLWGARRFLPHGAPYPLRQGVSNLFRPRNQTAMVVLALGFGISLLGVLYLVEQSILGRFSFDASAAQPNLLLFDIQRDQRAGVEALFSGRGVALRDVTPIVPARIGAINGRPVAEILADSAGRRVPGWALRREYRNTYRDTVTATERVVAGEWWGKARERERERERERAADRPIGRISMEADLARDLGVGVGDRITWDVQGVPIETVIANVRTVEWARFAPNFFVIFEPGILEEAPQSVVALARVEGAPARAELERELVQRFSNISVLDLARVQETLEGVVGKVNLAVRFLALFSIAGGVVVLAGALTAGRSQRMREGVLLRTLGASRRQVRRILLTEYMALGAMAGAAGLLLAALGAWPLVTRLFKLDYRLPLLPLLAAWGALALLAALIGVLNDRGAGERSPREVLGE